MRREITSVVVSMIFTLGACTAPTDTENASSDSEPDTPETESLRNPFGHADIEADFFGKDLDEWASNVDLAGDDIDPNAEAWAAPSSESAFDSIDGEWPSRWSETGRENKGWASGIATIKTVGERVFFRYRGDAQDYMCEAKREGNRLVGTYVNLFDRRDNGPWVGIIVDTDRIDGKWLDGRWDFRRVAADAR